MREIGINYQKKFFDDKATIKAKAQFFEYGRKCNTRDVFLDYIWSVVFAASIPGNYSFSQLHSYSYSIIALQELKAGQLFLYMFIGIPPVYLLKQLVLQTMARSISPL